MTGISLQDRTLGRRAFVVAAVAAVLMAHPAVAQVETPTSSGPVSLLDTPIFRIPFRKSPPKIDGVMEAKEWEDASALSGFWYDRHQAKFYFMAPIQTQVQLYAAYDKENIYFAYTSPVFPEKSWLKASGRFPDVVGHPQYGLQWDDHIELEIRPHADLVKGFRLGLFKWFVNPIGTTTDQHWSQKEGEGMRWQSKMKVASDVTGKLWTLEMAVPFSRLRSGAYGGKDADGRDIVKLPVADGQAYRVWFTRAIGGNGAFFNAFDSHCWNTTKTKMIFDSKAPSFQINELGPIMDDVIDVQLSVKNHNIRSETVRLGFFVESAEGTVYSSYEDEQLKDGMLELVPGEVRKLRLRKKFPGITTDGNVLWFDVRSAGRPAKPLFQTRLIQFHSMEGGRYKNLDDTETSFRWARVDVIGRMRPPRKDFDFWYTYSAYKNRMSAVVDKGIYGASDKARTAVEAKLTVMEANDDERIVIERTIPFRRDHACFLFDMPKLANGHYKVVLLLFDKNKRIVGESERKPFYKGDFPWVKNKVGLNDVVWEPYTAIKTDANGFDTLKHRFTVGQSGLPAQIFIKPDPRELPLEKRGPRAKVTDGELVAIGRGPQFRKPMRIEAEVKGRRVAAKVVQPAKLVRTWKSELQYQSKLKVGPLDVALDVQYDCDGAMTVKLTYGSDQAVEVDALELVADLTGFHDMVVTSVHGGGMAGPDKWECSLLQDEGVVWDSAKMEFPGLYYSHFMPMVLVGSGDRAFTWLADSDEHWTIDRNGSTMLLERDKSGALTWRVKFVNHTAKIKGHKTVEFVLLTQPSRSKPKGFRRLSYFQKGDVWAHLWGPKFGTDAEIAGQWREANRVARGLPDSARATYGKKDAPWDRFYQLRGSMPAFPALMKNALTGDLLGRMRVIPTTRRVKRIIKGREQWVVQNAGGGMATMGQAWQDLFVWHFGRQVRLARRHGWWWDETWPTYRSSNLAAGEAYLRDPKDVGEKELPWQDKFLSLKMRGMFKRLARVFKESGVPCRNSFWANNSATAFASFGYDTMLVEECSSDHKSYELDHVVVYPNSLVKYNSHNFTGLVTRLVPRHGWPNMIVSRPGDDKRLDRQLLGRALLNDIGLQPSGPHGRFQHNEQCLRFINALIDFGYFADDGRTEMIPYWRNQHIVRYGERFSADSAFELSERDPYAKVYVTVYRRPVIVNGRVRGTKAMFVIMNESDKPIRERLIITDPARLWGRRNYLAGSKVTGGYDFSKIDKLVPDSDWRKGSIVRAIRFGALRDMEDNGLIQEASNKGRKGQLYGPVYIHPHDYRILYGQSTR